MMLATTIIPFQNEKKAIFAQIHVRYRYQVWFVVKNLLSWEDSPFLLSLWTWFLLLYKEYVPGTIRLKKSSMQLVYFFL
jgi:hypothetical protein